jgi:hypothetical protein
MVTSSITHKPVTGTDLIRDAARSYQHKVNSVGMCQELGIPTGDLHAFFSGTRTLAIDKLQALTKFLWHGHAEFLPDENLLASVNRNVPVKPIGRPPSVTEMYDSRSLRRPEPFRRGVNHSAHRPVNDKRKASVSPTKRTGWA